MMPTVRISMRATAVVLCVLSLCAVGCSKKAPAEANAALAAALNALPKAETKTFTDAVVPSQRENVTSLEEWSFFQAVKSHKIDNEFDMNVTDTSAYIMVVLYFDDEQEAFSTVYFIMKKVGDKWLIDLTETIRKEKDTDGSDAFKKVLKFVPAKI